MTPNTNMKAQEDWNKFQYIEDGTVLITPCIGFSLYLETAEPEGIRDFYDRSLEALGDQLKYYLTDTMRSRSKINKRGLSAVPTWLNNPRRDEFGIQFTSVRDYYGVSPEMIELHLSYSRRMPGSESDLEKQLIRHRKFYEKKGMPRVFIGAALYVTLPLDHMLSEPDKLLEWIKGVKIVREKSFVTGNCGYALNYNWSIAPKQRNLGAICRRHPGFEFYASLGNYNLMRYRYELNDYLHLAKRVSWLTLLSEKSVDHLGGKQALNTQFDQDDIELYELKHGILIKAGPHPQIGNLGRRDLIPVYRKVAEVIRQARIDRFFDGPEWMNEWLDAFEKDYE